MDAWIANISANMYFSRDAFLVSCTRPPRLLSIGPVLMAIAAVSLSQEQTPDFVVADDVPRTHQPFGGQPSEVKFVVVSDRTGAPQPGVFEDAIAKVNRLHPHFVMSVGDLIKGYTRDPAKLDMEWSEIDNILRSLDMPFFYVPGNHDTSNPWMEEQWRKRLGRPYYYFTYKNVLFLVLQTEDGGTPGITGTQAAYFKQVLSEHSNVRWTFVFMHRPLWLEDNDQGYNRIGDALEGRDYTLFSGHRHNYFFTRRGTAKHFVLATSGGGSPLRGEAYGEFHHVTQVTLAKGEPKIINVRLDGLVSEDVVSDSEYPLIETLRKGRFFRVAPTVADQEDSSLLETRLTLVNPNAEKLHISGELVSPYPGWHFMPSVIKTTLHPGVSNVIDLRLEYLDQTEGVSLANLPPVRITLTGTFDLTGGDVTMPATHRWQIDWVRPLVETTEETAVDDRINPIPGLDWIPFTPPGETEEGWDWHGDNDFAGEFVIWKTPEALMFVGRFTDDRWEFTRPDLSDQFWLYLKSTANGLTTRIHLAPQSTVSRSLEPHGAPVGSTAFADFDGPFLTLKVRIPRAALGLNHHEEALRFNLACMDHDRPAWEHPSVLHWQPAWDGEMDFIGSGTFISRSGPVVSNLPID